MKLTKKRISEQVDHIKKVMQYPSRLNDDLKYGEIGRLINSSNMIEEVSTKLDNNGYAYNEEVIQLFYDAVSRLDTLSTAKITDYVYQEIKNMNAKENNNKDLYERINDEFKEYEKTHSNISEYAYDFFTNLNEYVPGIINEHFNYENNADTCSRSYHNPISFIDEKKIDYLLEEALQNNKLNKIFSNINQVCIDFQREIKQESNGDQFDLICFEIGTSLSNIYSRLTSYGPNSI